MMWGKAELTRRPCFVEGWPGGLGGRGPDDTYEGHAAAAEAGVDVHLGLGHLLALPTGLQQSLQELGIAPPSMAAPSHHHGPLLDHARQVGRDPQHPCSRGQQLARRRLESGSLWDRPCQAGINLSQPPSPASQVQHQEEPEPVPSATWPALQAR